MLPSGNSSAAATPRRNSVSSLTLFGSGMENLRFICLGFAARSGARPIENLADRWERLHDESSPKRNEGSMRPIQPPQLKLRRARKGRRSIWVIKDREREISTGAGEGERGKAEIAFAEYLVKNHQPFFGDGRPNQVLIGDCLAVYCDKIAHRLPGAL